ncbi:hypothetical protein BDR26DRAFT_645603 [Obelidium mucronatum]|nr:hypothetical protein BDR26DRAFT_645603 [Obelidium mucronatum]
MTHTQDSHIFRVSMKSYNQCIPALSNMFKLFRMLDETSNSLLVHSIDSLWNTGLAVLPCIQYVNHPLFTIECFESWFKYLKILGYIPPSLNANVVQAIFDTLALVLLQRQGRSANADGSGAVLSPEIIEQELLLDDKVFKILDWVAGGADSDLDQEGTWCEQSDAFQIAFSACGVEGIVSRDLVPWIRHTGLKVTILKVLSRVLENSVLQSSELVTKILELGTCYDLHDELVVCLKTALMQSQAAHEVEFFVSWWNPNC